MGYSHYWYREPELPSEPFGRFVGDVNRILTVATDMGLKLAGGLGKGAPEAKGDRVWFNGVRACGHTTRDMGIAWPAPAANGVETEEDVRVGQWFAGATLSARACGGDCSHETCAIYRVEKKQPWVDGPLMCACCKTAYKPYDVVVTAVLIAFKHAFGATCRVSSDGDDPQWTDGRILCHVACGYGMDFHLERVDDEKELVERSEVGNGARS